jgi:chromosomal replication initiation ATPase DnaA
MKPHRHNMVMQAITERIAFDLGESVQDITSYTRIPEIVSARWAVWSACHEAGFSYSAIARHFQRDHVTIMHGVKSHKARTSK